MMPSSPDGLRILTRSSKKGGHAFVWDSKTLQRVAGPFPHYGYPNFSPDGRWFLVNKGDEKIPTI